MSKQQKQKYTAKDYIIALVLFVAFGLAFWAIIDYESTPTDIATDTQVWDVLETSGYILSDVTQQRLEKEPQCGLLKSIVAQKDDIRIEFHVFESDKRAQSVWVNAYSFIRKKELNPHSQTGHGNRVIYQTTVQEKYYVVVQVGNTLSFATSNPENAGDINSFLISIGYLEPSKPSKPISDKMESVIAICLYLIILFPLSRISLYWIWQLICKRTGITSEDLDLYDEEVHHKFSFKSTRYVYFSQKVKDPKKFKIMFLAYKACFLPLYFTILLKFISIFTDLGKFDPDKFALVPIFVVATSGLIQALYKRIYLPLRK